MNVLDGLKIDKMSQTPIYVQVENGIRAYIKNRSLRPGDPLISPSEMARVLDVSHLTIRRAIRSLADQNILTIIPSRGTFVAEDVNVRRVLWVVGVDQTRGDISPYYSNLLRFATIEAEHRGLHIEPVWLTAFKPNYLKSFLRRTDLGHYAGFIFHECGPEHLLLHEVIKRRMPCVCVRAVGNVDQPFTVSLDMLGGAHSAMKYFQARGHARLLIVKYQDWPLGSDLDYLHGIHAKMAAMENLEPILCQLPRNRKCIAHIIQDAYDGLAQYHRCQGSFPKAIYFTDDILARGGILFMTGCGSLRQKQDLDILVRCGREEITPLGLAVTYQVKETVAEARDAVDLLDEQIRGRLPRDPHRVIPFFTLPFEQVDPPPFEETVFSPPLNKSLSPQISAD